jgi:hypothetical protein
MYRRENTTGKIGEGDVYFYHTDRLSEKPINIIIRKDKLKQIAEKEFTIQ